MCVCVRACNYLSVSLQVGAVQRLNKRLVMVALLRKMECVLLEVHATLVLVYVHVIYIFVHSVSCCPSLDEESTEAQGTLKASGEGTSEGATVLSVRGNCCFVCG